MRPSRRPLFGSAPMTQRTTTAHQRGKRDALRWGPPVSPDANDLAHGIDEDLSVADFPGARGFDDGVNRGITIRWFDADLQHHLGDEADVHFGAAIAFGVAGLAAVAFDFDGGDAEDSESGE